MTTTATTYIYGGLQIAPDGGVTRLLAPRDLAVGDELRRRMPPRAERDYERFAISDLHVDGEQVTALLGVSELHHPQGGADVTVPAHQPIRAYRPIVDDVIAAAIANTKAARAAR